MDASAANYHVLSIIETCTRLGVDRASLLALARVEEESLLNPYDRQPQEKVIKLWQEAQRLSDTKLLPFHVGRMGSRLHRSAITSMIEACSSLGEALELGLRYQHLTQNIVQSTLIQNGNEVMMSVSCSQLNEQDARPQVERQLSFVVAEARNLAADPRNQLKDIEVHFRYEPLDSKEQYSNLLGARVRFGQENNQLIFPRSILSLKNFSPNHDMKSSLLGIVEQQNRMLAGSETVEQQVREFVEAALGNRSTDIEAIAPLTGMSVRTLQRRLTAAGTSFSEVLDSVRKSRALLLMKQQELHVSEVAYQLGFSHITGFYNAFHRWTGMAPKVYQNQHQANPAR